LKTTELFEVSYLV